MNTRCAASIWGAHKYEARYDEKPDEVAAETVRIAIAARVQFSTQSTVVRTYIQDVCIHCGDVIDRPEGSKS